MCVCVYFKQLAHEIAEAWWVQDLIREAGDSGKSQSSSPKRVCHGIRKKTAFWRSDSGMEEVGLVLFGRLLTGRGISRWLSGNKSACQCIRYRRLGFDPWARKLPWRRGWQPTPVFLPWKPHGQRSLWLQSVGSQTVRLG